MCNRKLYETVGLLGSNGGTIKNIVDISIVVESTNTARIQEVHITAGHAVIEYGEARLIEERFLKNN